MSGTGGGGQGTQTENGFTNVSNDSLIFFEQVDGVAVNTNVWVPTTSGMTIVQSGGFITLNAGLAVAANAYAILACPVGLATVSQIIRGNVMIQGYFE